MKSLKILLTLIIIYTILNTSLACASSVSPGIKRVALPQGQRKQESVVYYNNEDTELNIAVKPYAYDPITDEISEDSKDIFLKADTDIFQVKANESITIKYEIIPISNIPNGTYFNILTLTPVIENDNLQITQSISQLVILDIIDSNQQVEGITTTQFLTNITVLKRGIPFLSPLVLRYTITNDSNYVLTPQGRIDLFNERNDYKPTYVYINKQEDHLYPNEVLQNDIEITTWHISDLFTNRIAFGQIYNGLDSNPQNVEIEIKGYTIEILAILIVLIIFILLIKSIKQDKVKKKDLKGIGRKPKKKKVSDS
jgi:hypothetical protein